MQWIQLANYKLQSNSRNNVQIWYASPCIGHHIKKSGLQKIYLYVIFHLSYLAHPPWVAGIKNKCTKFKVKNR